MKIKTLLFSLALLIVSGCATVRAPVSGVWYTDVKSSLDVTSNAAGSKAAQSCSVSILGLIATGDSSIEAARRSGQITTITSVDHSSFSVLGLYAKYCTIVRGQ